MAWRSSGTTNDEMVDNLKRFGVISSITVEEGFRSVDRRYFVPQNLQNVAHSDQPLKEGNVHISAPHIYGSVLEALELRPSSSLSFLNVGSGTGYLSCIAATILGPCSSHFCIEIHEDVVQHCKESIERWKHHHPPARAIHHIDVIHGNGLEVVANEGEALLGFDRIYIGAAIETKNLALLKKLLKPGGVLVGPVDDELIKVVRIQAPRGLTIGGAQEFSQQVISGVRFAPLLNHPALPTVIPSRVWSPSIHQYYPGSFRQSCKAILLCSNASYMQHVNPQPIARVNMASMLPRVLWMEIMSYAHRDWFEGPQSEVEFLRRRLAEEQANSQRANVARLEAETRCHMAERERDVYRLLARRWQSRLNSVLNQRDDDLISESGSIEDAAASVLLSGREEVAISGLGGMFRRFRARVAAFESSDDDEDNGESDLEQAPEQRVNRMDEDEEEMNEDMVDDDDSSSTRSDRRVIGSNGEGSVAANMSLSPATTKAIAARPQFRAVSISGEDL